MNENEFEMATPVVISPVPIDINDIQNDALVNNQLSKN